MNAWIWNAQPEEWSPKDWRLTLLFSLKKQMHIYRICVWHNSIFCYLFGSDMFVRSTRFYPVMTHHARLVINPFSLGKILRSRNFNWDILEPEEWSTKDTKLSCLVQTNKWISAIFVLQGRSLLFPSARFGLILITC